MEQQPNPSLFSEEKGGVNPSPFSAERGGTNVPNPQGAQPAGKRKSSRRKVIGVSLVIIALLVGGAVYAWQNSFSTVSLGGLTQDFNFLQLADEDLAADQAEGEGSSFSELVERETQIPQEETQIETSVPSEEIVRVEPEARSLFAFAAQNSHFLSLLAPNGGETFCLRKQVDIRWEHRGVGMIQFYLQQAGGTFYDLGVFPAGPDIDGESGEGLSIQQAGSGTAILPEPGSDYIVTIVDVDNPAIIDTSNATFSIANCEE